MASPQRAAAAPTAPTAARLAVLGSPISHSQSPALHRAAYGVLGLDWSYDAIEVSEGSLTGFIDGLGTEWRGLSLTMPLKTEAAALISDLDSLAQHTGAVNTVLLRNGATGRTLSGFNTDVPGLVRALAEGGVREARRVVLLGAGATASSALISAAEIGAESVDILVRSPRKAAPLVELGRSRGLVVTVSQLPNAEAGNDSTPGRPITTIPALDSPASLMISTLPGGSLLGDVFSADFRRDTVLFDVSYSPWPSALALAWQRADGTVLNGLSMLLHQALIQVRIFVNGDPFEPVEREHEVLAAMRGALTV
ncbi:shikimate dehydrogenase [Leifsonia kafniensis]|uniref:Shikimate dehydrogenase n=2 Tax=Leifsonia kafniensis TaxID=475957 RepID=A0ABP7K716_9MICO